MLKASGYQARGFFATRFPTERGEGRGERKRPPSPKAEVLGTLGINSDKELPVTIVFILKCDIVLIPPIACVATVVHSVSSPVLFSSTLRRLKRKKEHLCA